ncbi:MAG TPA: hypothetical protein VM076_14930 [Gemmatimonadaceae bacterium]|nr:hypothetical protein [Gemmatimonadaceae bacterium]
MRKPQPKPPTYEALLAAIGAATSAAVLAPLLQTATTYFTGTQREALEAAIMQRRRELPDGEELVL